MRKVYLTDSNTLNQIRPKSAEIKTERLTGSEVKELFELLESLEKEGEISIENKIKRDGYSYGLFLSTGGKWYPAVEKTKEAILDVPYGDIAVNFTVANTTGLDINDRDNWDKGFFDLQVLILTVEKPGGEDWKTRIFGED